MDNIDDNKWLKINDNVNNDNNINNNIINNERLLLYNIIIREALETYIRRPRPLTPTNIEIRNL